MKLQISKEVFRLKKTFTISRSSRDVAHVVTVTLTDANYRGRGECVPYARYGESIESVTAEIDMMRTDLVNDLDRDALQQLLPAGAARNALDCALWDLEARRLGIPVWQLAGLDKPGPLVTACTLSLDTPAAMYDSARDLMHMPILKLKLGGAADVDRLRAVRAGAPDSKLIVDANEGWNIQDYKRAGTIDGRVGCLVD